jgi:hypothetical protein
MGTPATIPIPRYVRWLPYWAVFQTDLRQTLRSWVWRTWVLTVVLCCGVTVGALCCSTVLGVSVLWLGLCAAGFVLSFLPGRYPTPDRVLAMLPQILRGEYDWQALWRMTEVGLGASLAVSLVGMIGFARSDV